MQLSKSEPLAQPLLILGFDADASLANQLASVLADFGVAQRILDRRLDEAEIAEATASMELAIVVVARPESVGADVTGLIDRILALRGKARVVVATPQGTFSAALLDLDRKKHVPLLDLGRRLEPGSEAIRRLRKRVASSLIAATPLDLPASLYRTAIHQRSVEVLAENLTLAASRPLRDWELARPDDGGARPSPLWASWLAATRSTELARLGVHLDELRVQALIDEARGAKS